MLAERLNAIAEPTRIRILTLLEQREASVQELADELGAPHQNASKHLQALYRAGIVTRRRAGGRVCVYYALADYTACVLVRDAIASLVAHVEELAAVVRFEP